MPPGRSAPRGGAASRVARAVCAALLATALPAGAARADQGDYTTPPRMSATQATLQWIVGRFRRPLTCERADGSTVDVEESVAFRPAREDRRGETVRATFFGVDVSDAVRCYSTLEPSVPDRRGVLFITFLAPDRPDVGLSQLRRELEDGELTYQVRRGRLRVRALGDDADEPREVDLAGGRTELVVRLVPPTSDAGKLLARYAAGEGPEGAALRRLEIELRKEGVSLLRVPYLEDGSRWR